MGEAVAEAVVGVTDITLRVCRAGRERLMAILFTAADHILILRSLQLKMNSKCLKKRLNH